jgi:hypothetical protein
VILHLPCPHRVQRGRFLLQSCPRASVGNGSPAAKTLGDACCHLPASLAGLLLWRCRGAAGLLKGAADLTGAPNLLLCTLCAPRGSILPSTESRSTLPPTAGLPPTRWKCAINRLVGLSTRRIFAKKPQKPVKLARQVSLSRVLTHFWQIYRQRRYHSITPIDSTGEEDFPLATLEPIAKL